MYAGVTFKMLTTGSTVIQTVSTYNEFTLLSTIGSIFTTAAGIYGLIHLLLTADAEDVTLMNKSYTFKPTGQPTEQTAKTDTRLLVDTAKAYCNINFTWREQLCIRLLCCCKLKDRKSRMFENGKKQLYKEMDLIKLIKQLRVAAFMSEVYLKPH